jgi:glycosyltransferase involved in cell wall biosynthesis
MKNKGGDSKAMVKEYFKKMPALNLTPDAVQINVPKLMGRQSAGQGFLRAFVAAYNGEDQTLPLITYGQREVVEQEIRQVGWQGKIHTMFMKSPGSWGDIGIFYCPAPISSELAWLRARRGLASYALCGVTHTISSSTVMNQLASYLRDPFAPWDALICTSRSVVRSVEHIWAAELGVLSQRFGKIVPPKTVMTPIIPLGIHTADYVAKPNEREKARVQFKFQENEIVLLFVGRLCLHAKANPLPMYLALAKAAKKTGKTVRFLECGWFANEFAQKTYDEALKLAGIKLTRVDGRQKGVTHLAYLASDIFISLSDNIQETFGLTPVEAMAAGLPVVVSDWDGYRETVRDKVDGFLIPTYQPSDLDAGKDLALAYEDGRLNYDQYVGFSHAMISVDVEATVLALVELITKPELRKKMGQAGQERARNVYDWKVVFPQYQALWSEQDAMRNHALREKKQVTEPIENPRFMNPLKLFSHYPSHFMSGNTYLWREGEQTIIDVENRRNLGMWGFLNEWLPTSSFLQQAFTLLPEAKHSQAAMLLTEWAKKLNIPLSKAQRVASWMHKVGLICCENKENQVNTCAREDRAK